MRHEKNIDRLGPGERLVIRTELVACVEKALEGIRECALRREFATAMAMLDTALKGILEVKRIDLGDVFHVLDDVLALEDRCHDMHLLLYGQPHVEHRLPHERKRKTEH